MVENLFYAKKKGKFQEQNRNERPNRSTNNGDKVDKDKRDVVRE